VKLYEHQLELANACLDDLRSGETEVLLAACPGFGKTETAIHIISTMLEEGRCKRALVLAHGTTVLRNNFRERIQLRRPDLLESGQVRVALPHEHKKLEGDYEFVVVDEAHEFYDVDDGMVQACVNNVGAQQALLLTGSPSRFIKQGMKVHSYALHDLFQKQLVPDIRIELAVSDYRLDDSDWNEYGETKEAVKYTQGSTDKTLDGLFKGLLHRADLAKEKTIIACRSVEMANQVSLSLKTRHKVNHLVSEYEDDADSMYVRAFLEGQTPVLVVVKRATLGFDMPALNRFIDLTGSRNPDRIFQMCCRLARKPEGPCEKTFIKVMPQAFSGAMLGHFMTGVMMLAKKEIYDTWEGGSFVRLKTPVRDPDRARMAMPGKMSPDPLLESGMMLFGDLFETVMAPAAGPAMRMAMLGEVLGKEVRDAAGKKAEIVSYYELTGELPGRDHPLFSSLSHYRSVKSSAYDPEFHNWCSDKYKVRRREERPCGSCSAVFMPIRNRETRCPRCREVKPIEPRTCACGVVFKPTARSQKFHSRKCVNVAMTKKPYVYSCVVCGRERASKKISHGPTCSQACGAKLTASKRLNREKKTA
jgi:hypothetical protein